MNRRNFISSAGAIGAFLARPDAGQQLVAASAPTDLSENCDPLFQGTPAVFAPTGESLTMVFPLHGAAIVWVE